MLQGHQTWEFAGKPAILGAAAVVGPFEAKGPLQLDFDVLHASLDAGQDSWEKAERQLLEEACDKALEKAKVDKEQVNFFLGGDLMNQIITSSFAARTLTMPFLGLFGACSTAMEGLALASLLVDKQCAKYALAGTASHNAAAEKQYRYPTEYGAQKPPTAQWTVTAGGAALVGSAVEGQAGHELRVTSATVGRVVDMGLSDPFNMGAAMAPAAFETIVTHHRDRQLPFDHYDRIVTGDLGRVGHEILCDMFKKHRIAIPLERYEDCGRIIYGDDPSVWSGGSGCGCVASVTFGHWLRRLREKEFGRMLVVATGALLSPISYQQKESIPCIAHAVSIERAE